MISMAQLYNIKFLNEVAGLSQRHIAKKAWDFDKFGCLVTTRIHLVTTNF